jgi:vacuolar-type H+-ATPase subunit H
VKVDEILDRFEYMVHHARHVPFSSQVMVDEDEVMDLIDQLRFNLPEEMKQASWTVQEQQRLISEAHAEAARIMAKANERAEAAVTDHEVLRRAERQSQQTVRDAQARSEQIIREAEAYALEQLQQLEAHLSRTLATVKRGVEALHASTAGPEPPPDGRVASPVPGEGAVGAAHPTTTASE